MKILNNVEQSKGFCILPWIHLHAWPDKRVLPCCVADSNMPVSDTDKGSILDIMNSDRYKQIRLEMLEDKQIPECKRCYSLEEYGIWSLRQSNNRRRFESVKELVENTNEDGSIEQFKLKYLDIRFSNLCNMKCRTCGPACSSRWAEEFSQMYGKKHLNVFNMTKIVASNNEDNQLLDKLRPYLLDVEEVYFAGGEAMITNEHYDILDYWLENNHTNVELTYTTNFLTLRYKNKNALDYWKKFKDVRVWASLDAMGPTLELMRHGAIWEDIHNNIIKVKQDTPHVKLGITPTISIWNVFHFPKLHRFLLDNNLIGLEDLRLNILTHPSHMALDILPRHIAEKAEDIWWEHYHYLKFKHPYEEEHLGQLRTVCTALHNANGNIDNIFEIIPEIVELEKWMKENS
jgi:hypothetical protein